ncbi:alpha-L-arabinofuranosidase C-terminal domain-containing protein [Paludisphaera mucosa]|uniref:non-reducing end alpha-L-arabinofuranosidase n=1 Tax=Paludisphaera mucosa TaxID=3030827 RepID=A0ABT6FCX9_9BACT|nr:alpha-L-arabinofuranosidase C-terminal domain-containing protein [Paludisphaera mucosa]MDG3005405.1 alpha-L-arabinofuranosidase C-terminal domain-containing protein [Paludisphaera mucosa]
MRRITSIWRGSTAAPTLVAIALLARAGAGHAQAPATLEVDVSKPGVTIPAEFFGLMTEEINHAYDGGLFAELIQNRTFQDPRPERRGPGGGGPGGPRDRLPIHWSVLGTGKAAIDDADPVSPALPLSLRLDFAGGESGVANDGFWGIPVRPDATYTATFYAKAAGGFDGPVTASIRLDQGDAVVASSPSPPITGAWKKYTVKLATGPDAPTTAKARFVLSADGAGSVAFSLVSLFPPTYQGAPNGLRPDLMELMAELRPKFIRLPGGNYLEGNRFADRFNWKKMIGPVESRPGHMAPWGYRSSDGFGLPEFLLWCKQLGAEPILGVFAGYVLNGDHFDAGSPEMAVYTQEALDEIEYIAGPADGAWGAKRAADGFPEPFPLRYVEIGNEDWFDRSGSYDGRFTQMARAIREKYPHLKIIASAPVKSFRPDLVDDHFYRSAGQLFGMSSLYDPRPSGSPPPAFAGGGWNGRQPDGVKTFVGEWATQEGRPTPNLNAALADAAFIMGLEKNSDVVPMQCYAPLLVNLNEADPARGYPRAWQWNTNLIGYDALRSFGSPSYHAQVMLAQNKGDVVLPARFEVPPAPAGEEPARGRIGVGSWRTEVEYADLSVTAPDGRALLNSEQARDVSRWRSAGGDWTVRDGSIRPAARDAETWAFTGDAGWTDYTLRLRARKVRGSEGFIVIWHAADDDHYRWWNVGGWENTLARCEAADGGGRTPYGTGAPFTVEAGRWYDLRLEVAGRRMRGFIDDKLVTEAADERPAAAPASTLATATQDRADHAVLVKVVNMGRTPVVATVDIRGVGRIEPDGTALVIAGDPGAVNTLDDPKKVAPRRETLAGASTSFPHTFPPHSFTILRLKTAAE